MRETRGAASRNGWRASPLSLRSLSLSSDSLRSREGSFRRLLSGDALQRKPSRGRGRRDEEEGREEQTFTFQEAVDVIGFGRFHVLLMVLCAFGWFAEITELVINGFVAPSVQRAFDLTPIQYGVFGSSSFVGMAAGAAFWGYVSDRFGRRISFSLTPWTTFVGGFLSALAPNYWTLLLLRFTAAFGIGGMLPVDLAHLVEFLPTKWRGRNLVMVDAIGMVPALLFASSLGVFFSSGQGGGEGDGEGPGQGEGSTAWRMMLAVGALPAALFGVVRSWVPESPRWDMTNDELAGAIRTLQSVARINGRGARVPQGRLLPLEGERAQGSVVARVRELFTPALRGITPRLWAMAICAQFASAGTAYALPKLLEVTLHTAPQRVAKIQMVGVCGVVPLLGLAFLIIERSRLRALAYFYALASAATAVLALGCYVRHEMLAVLGFVVVRGAIEGIFAVKNCIGAEAYPTCVRASGLSVGSLGNDIGGMLSPLLWGVMSESFGTAILFMVIMASVFMLGVWPTLTMPYDNGGRAIQDRHVQLAAIVSS